MPQAQTLADCTYRLARDLGIVTEGVATSGDKSSLIDTLLLTQADDYWNDGTVWILRDSAEAGAAPEGEFARVSDFLNSANDATLANVAAGTGDALTTAVAAGDRYAIARSDYPIHQLISFINGALIDIGLLYLRDTSTITTAAAQTEYTLSTAQSLDLREVYIQTRTNDANDNRWEEIKNWTVRGDISGADILYLPQQYPANRSLLLVYGDEHPELDDATDAIKERIHIDLLLAYANVRALQWKLNQSGSSPEVENQLRRWIEPGPSGWSRMEMLAHKYKIRKPPRHSNLMILGRRVPVNDFTEPDPA